MKKISKLLLFLIIICSCSKKYSPIIKDYVDFLEQEHLSAKDYIFDLWTKYDVVMIHERDHADITQYDLFLDIIKDKRFIENVGCIFTELGTISIQDSVNRFIHKEFQSDSARYFTAIELYQNFTDDMFWNNTNIFNFLIELNKLNEGLLKHEKINLFVSDEPFPGWNNINSATEYNLWKKQKNQNDRDSIMAYNIINKVRELEKANIKRQKYLVIMNSRHAYNRDIEYTVFNNDVTNTGRYLFSYFKGNIANVLINNVVYKYPPVENDTCEKCSNRFPIQDGKWDAAFKVTNSDKIGFNFTGSPFGLDHFDQHQFSNHNLKYEDIFTGFVYYLPLEKHICMRGIPRHCETIFQEEYIRRFKIYSEVKKWEYDSLELEGQREKICRLDTFMRYDKIRAQYIVNNWIEE